MPLGKFHRKYGKPSSNDSLQNALFDQLLTSIIQGDEPLASEEQYWNWIRSWSTSHPDKSRALLDESTPWPILRREALNLLQLFDWETVSRFRKVIWEVDEPNDPSDWLTELDRVKTEWLVWRKAMIDKYRLQGFVPGAESLVVREQKIPS